MKKIVETDLGAFNVGEMGRKVNEIVEWINRYEKTMRGGKL